MAKKRKKQNKNYTPLILIGGGLVLLIATLAISVINSMTPSPKIPLEVSGAPSLKLDKEKVDLGDVQLGQTVQVAFALTNVGDETLRLSEEPYVEIKEGC